MMTFPSYDDWQAPWEKKGEDFDADIARKFIYNLQREADTTKSARATERQEAQDRISELEAKVQAFEDKDLSEVDRLRKENERLKETPAPKDDLAQARLEIALEKGLTLAQSKRLAGATREELEADADAYRAELGNVGDDDGGDDAVENGEMPSNRPLTSGSLRGGFGGGAGVETIDPAQMADSIGRY